MGSGRAALFAPYAARAIAINVQPRFLDRSKMHARLSAHCRHVLFQCTLTNCKGTTSFARGESLRPPSELDALTIRKHA